MKYQIFISNFDKNDEDQPRFTTMAESAHRAFVGPFNDGLEVTLLELPKDDGTDAPYRLALELRDRPAGTPLAPPAVNYGYDYELMLQHQDRSGRITQAVSIGGAHRMLLASDSNWLELVLTQLPNVGSKQVRLHLALREA
jgi:hypothetical protein